MLVSTTHSYDKVWNYVYVFLMDQSSLSATCRFDIVEDFNRKSYGRSTDSIISSNILLVLNEKINITDDVTVTHFTADLDIINTW